MSKIAIRSMCDDDATILGEVADNVGSNKSDDITTEIKKEKSIYMFDDATILGEVADNVDSNKSDDIITNIKKEKSIYISKPKSRQFFIKKYVYEEDHAVKLSCKSSLRQRREA